MACHSMIEIQRRPEPDLSLLPDHIDPLLRRLYLSRGVSNVAQLEKAAKALHSFKQLHGIDRAVELLFAAIAEQKRIIVVGDLMPMAQPVRHFPCSRCVCSVVVMSIT